MDRRTLLALAGGLLSVPRALFAQPSARVYRIAILNDGNESTRQKDWEVFRTQLAKLGLVEGKNLSFDVRYARGSQELLPKLAAEIVASKPDLIVSAGTPASHAAKAATSTIPLVFIAVGDPVGTGLVASLARPGGNGTGVSVVTSQIAEKSFELLRELVPSIQRLGFMGDPANPAMTPAYRLAEEFARKHKLSVRILDAAEPAALERSFATIRKERIQGLYVDAAGRVLIQREKIVQFFAREKLPAVYGRHDYTDIGGLLSYETDRQLTFTRGAGIVHRVLQGAKPADIPVEQTNKIRMVINMKTARTLGIKVPSSLGMRADEIID